MPATIRIDFDVHAENISEALKNELSKVQGVISAANTAIETSSSQRIAKVANESIESEKKIAQEAIKAQKIANDEKRKIDKAFADYEKQLLKEEAAAEKQKDKELSDYEKQLAREDAIAKKQLFAEQKAAEKQAATAAREAEKQAEFSNARSTQQLREKAERDIEGVRSAFSSKLHGDEKKAATAIINEIAKLQEQKDSLIRTLKLEDISKVEQAQVNAEKKKLERELATIRRVALENKEIAEHGAAASVGIMGIGRNIEKNFDKAHTAGLGAIAGIGIAVAGFEKLSEKAHDYAEAQAKLHAATGLQMEDAEEVGKTYNKTGEETATVMAKVKFATGAQGEQLKEQTKAVMAYAVASGLSEERVAKQMQTETGRAKIFADAKRNEAIAQEKANDPAMKAQFIQEQLMSTIGKVASVVLTAFAPALNAAMPIIDALGGLVTAVIEPALKSLEPVMTIISDAFKQLVPVIVQLVTIGVSLLQPILESLSGVLGDMIPPIVQIALQIANALMPVFKALAPIIKIIANIFGEEMKTFIGMFITQMETVFVPLLQNAVVPILMSLIPVIQMIAEIFQSVMVPALKLAGGIFDWLMKNIIQPMINYMSGTFTKVINGAVGVVKDVIGAIKKVADAVGSVISFFGGGSDEAAKGATKVAQSSGESVSAENARQAAIEQGNEAKRSRIALADKLKHGKISAKELAELRQQAEDENDGIMLQKIETFEKKKSAQAASAHSKAAKAVKDAYTEAKNAEEQRFKEEEAGLLQKRLNEHLNSDQFNKLKEASELTHTEKMKEFSDKFHKEQTTANIAYLNLQIANRTKADTDELEKLKAFFEEKKDIQQQSVTGATLTEREMKQAQYDIEVESYKAQIALLEKQGEDTKKITLEFNKFQRAHSHELHQQNLKDADEIIKLTLDTEKAKIGAMKDSLVKEKALLKLSLDEETAKEKKELIDAGNNEALKDAIHKEHEQKRDQISADFAKKEKQRKMDEISFVTGPLVAGFSKGFDQLNQKFFQPMLNKWINQKTFVGGILSDLTSSIIKFATDWIAQKALALAADVLFNTTEAASMATIAAAAAPAAAATSLASFGANSIAANAGMASTFAMSKLLSGFQDGGFTGYGATNQYAGPAHRNEFILKSGSFAVDSSGNLISVAGMGGGNAAVVHAIHNMTERLGNQFGQSTVINQNRMVLENKRTERSRSRESV